MKILQLPLVLSVIGASTASVGKPQLSINIRDGEFSGLEGLDPCVQWSTDGEVGDYFDYEMGADLAIRPSADIASLPKSAFGKISRKFGGWGLSARADVDLGGLKVDAADLDVQATHEELDLALKMLGTAGKETSLNKVELRKGFNMFNSKITVNPRFDAKSTSGDVVLSYDAEKTGVQVVASLDEQKLTVSQKILDNNIITPSVTTKGDFALQIKRNLADNESIATTIKPNESISVKWTDGDWVADIDAPMDGINIGNVNVGVKRKISFS